MSLLRSRMRAEKGLQNVAWFSVFDTNNGVWTVLPDMPAAISTKAIAHQGNIYIVGGYDGKPCKNFYQFTQGSSQWREMPPLPIGTSAHSMAVIHNSLYTFGNYDELAKTLRYDFNTGQWAEAGLPFKLSRHNASTSLDSSIYVIGRTTSRSGSHLNYIQKFTF